MIKPKFPTKEQIKDVINQVEKILEKKSINKRKNFFAKEGYTFCLELLNSRYENPQNDYFIADKEEELLIANEIYRKQIEVVKELKTERGRTLAILCIDWLNGVRTYDKDENEVINFLNIIL